MTKGKKQVRALGYAMPKPAFKRYVSLIEMTTGRFGLHKRYFKSEETFWTAIEFITGMRKHDGETFVDAVFRTQGVIGSHTIEWRNTMIAKADRRGLYQAVGMKLQESIAFEEMEENAKALDAIRAKWRAKKVAAPKHVRRPHQRDIAPTVAAKDEFYKSWEWRTVRMEVLKEHGRTCQCCGAGPGMTTAAGDPVRICVDHIKPLSLFWHLRLDKSNLQVLCDECNQGKGNWDQTDFRPSAPDEWVTEESEVDPAILAQLADHTGRLQ